MCHYDMYLSGLFLFVRHCSCCYLGFYAHAFVCLVMFLSFVRFEKPQDCMGNTLGDAGLFMHVVQLARLYVCAIMYDYHSQNTCLELYGYVCMYVCMHVHTIMITKSPESEHTHSTSTA